MEDPHDAQVSPKAPMNIVWKRLAVASVCAGAGVVLMLGIAAFAIYRFEHPTTAPKEWPPHDLTAVGLRASLKSELRAGTAPYTFQVAPLSPDLATDFDRVARDDTVQKSFEISLRDSGGFRLCQEQVSALLPAVDDSGKVQALSGEGTIACSARDYLAAKTWYVTWVFPQLAKSTPPSFQPDFVPLPKRSGASTKPISGEAHLDSFSFVDGTLTTTSGSQFAISRPGQKFEVEKWPGPTGNPNKTPLRYTCDTKRNCTIENLWNGQTVNAQLLKYVPED